MDIRQLKYFVTIAEEESITVAARKHNMSQPPLSTQLKQMETELGMSLFDRTGKKLRLTPEGALFYEQAKEVIAEIASLRQNLEAHIFQGISEQEVALYKDITAKILKNIENLKNN